MSYIPLPQKVQYTKGKNNSGTIEVLGCYPGYGKTLGNALRRTLLSSLEGAAVTSATIKGATHEFSAIDGVLEDVVQIVLNLKQLRFTIHSDDAVRVTIKVKGDQAVTAADIKTTSDVEIVDPTQHIATITDAKTTLEMELTIKKGMGYIPVEQQDRDDAELGAIAIDAVYSPMKRVNFTVENMRVGKRTDFEKVLLEIETDGSLAPDAAFETAVGLMVAQFTALQQGQEAEPKVADKE